MSLLDQVQQSMSSSVQSQQDQLASAASESSSNNSPQEMMKLQESADNYSISMEMESDLMKTITSTEKAIAQNIR
ncbi:EscF/YscF/HrpA family type III secretion system needle major subunit [Desulfovibrio inopinatus]|uniref:EscF/YscF/HrpA family type III secretion system needle major subunit n=1 Tax=Desulfovibrio inopinatus TaxID=102109 RepID=UPI00041D49A0|nr:EscF/YscF/HrpA family type III secretion system needle major subunit [Desulfovibrio inopinatus]